MYEYFSAREVLKLNDSIEVLNKLLNSPEFKERVLSSKFTYTNETPLQIYNTLMAGDEIINGKRTVANGIWEIDIRIYTSSWFQRSVVGYTYSYTLTTWINRRFFSWFTDYEAASNIAHEHCHKLGYGHPFKRTKDRIFSVPYQIGTIIDEMGAKLK
jgi:hypothetical protein